MTIESTHFEAICWITFRVQLSQILRQLLQTANLNRKAICKFCKNAVQAVKNHMQIKKATELSGLTFTMVEQRLLTANTIYANSVEIKVTRNWFAVVTFCESNNKKG